MSSETELQRLRVDYDSLRRRHDEDVSRARWAGRDEIMGALAEVVDDCDRALAALQTAGVPEQWQRGIIQMRDTALQRFAQQGYRPLEPLGGQFDPRQHEAVGIDRTPGHDNQITAVHRRGWAREGHLVIPAAVVVRTGSAEIAKNVERAAERRQQSTGHVVDSIVRRRRQPSAPTFYVCPYNSPGCQGDCEYCQAAQLA